MRNIKSFLMHVPVGLITAALLLVHPSAMCLFGAGFLVYEVVELYVINELCSPLEVLDKAYPEIAGYLTGSVLGFIAIYLLNLPVA